MKAIILRSNKSVQRTLSRKVCKLKIEGLAFLKLNPFFKYSQKLV